ncbi:MAG: hypothetical protein PHQ12_00010 [Chthoniobacteraceae bacterium]|nr:hypothetical protein [Chthoniobacteraceae bacterium]
MKTGLKNTKKASFPLPELPAGVPVPLPREILGGLRRVRARKVRVELAECLALLAAVVPSLWLAQGLADWIFNLPWTVRSFLLAGDAAGAAFLVYRFAFLPLTKRLTSRTAALLVEREIPSFHSLLISSVELSSGKPGFPQGSLDLVRETIARAAAHLRKLNVAREVISTARLKRWARGGLLGVVCFSTVFLAFPVKSTILLQRILLSRAPLPTKTIVVAVTEDLAVHIGSDVVLSASAKGVVPKSGRAFITYANNKKEVIPAAPGAEDPALFSVSFKNVQGAFRYHFVLNDGTGSEFNVRTLQPPTIESCRFVQSYPKYTGMKPAEMSPGGLSLLAGSRLQIEARTTQPLQTAELQIEGSGKKIPLGVSGLDKRSIKGELAVPKEGLTGFSLLLVNTDGIPSVQNTVYSVNFLPDTPPEVELTAPTADMRTVSLRSQPGIAFNTKDDFGIRKVTLRYETTRPAPEGAPPASPETGSLDLPLPPSGAACRHRYVWDFAKQSPPLTVGCKVEYWIEVTDNNDVTGPGTGQTGKKSFTVLSEAEKKTELLEALGSKAVDIETIYKSQKSVNEELDSTIRKYQKP